MSFGTEVKEFAAMFQLGSGIVESIKKRHLSEDELAARKLDAAERRRQADERLHEQTRQFDVGQKDWETEFEYKQRIAAETAAENKRRWEYEQGDQEKRYQTERGDVEYTRKQAEEQQRIQDIEKAIEEDPRRALYFGDYPYKGKTAADAATSAPTALPVTPEGTVTAGTATSGVPTAATAPAAPAATSALPPAAPAATAAQPAPTAALPPAPAGGGGRDRYGTPTAGAAVAAAAAPTPGPEAGTDTAQAPAVTAAGEPVPGTTEEMAKGAVMAGATLPAAQLGITPDKVSAAIDGGLKYLQNHFMGKDKQAVPEGAQQEKGVKELLSGMNGLTKEERALVDQIVDAEDIKAGIDPKQIADRMKNINVMVKTRDLFMRRGGEKNQKIADAMSASIIQEARNMSAILSESALNKLRKGDIHGAAQDTVRAIDQAPDGRSATYDPNTQRFQYTDDLTGKVIQEGTVTPEMIEQVATGIKDGGLFYKQLMQAAVRHDPTLAPPAETPLAMHKHAGAKKGAAADAAVGDIGAEGDTGAEGEAAGPPVGQRDVGTSFVDNLGLLVDEKGKTILPTDPATGKSKYTPEQIAQAMGPQHLAAANDLGNLIANENPDITPDKAGRLVASLTQPDLANPELWNFKLMPGSNLNDPNGDLIIKAADGTIFKLPTAVAAPIMYDARLGMTQLMRGLVSQQRVDEQAASTQKELGERRGAQISYRDKQRAKDKATVLEDKARKHEPGAGAIPTAKEAVRSTTSEIGKTLSTVGSKIKAALPTSQPKKVTETPRMITEPKKTPEKRGALPSTKKDEGPRTTTAPTKEPPKSKGQETFKEKMKKLKKK